MKVGEKSSVTIVQVFTVTHSRRFSVFRDRRPCGRGTRETSAIRKVTKFHWNFTNDQGDLFELLSLSTSRNVFLVTRRSSLTVELLSATKNLFPRSFCAFSRLLTAIRTACEDFKAEEDILSDFLIRNKHVFFNSCILNCSQTQSSRISTAFFIPSHYSFRCR